MNTLIKKNLYNLRRRFLLGIGQIVEKNMFFFFNLVSAKVSTVCYILGNGRYPFKQCYPN